MRLSILIYIAVMALTTYLVRMIPVTAFRKKITSRFARSFFYYIPYAVLAAMTFPAIFYSTGSLLSAAVGLAVAMVLAWKSCSLIVVSLAASLAAFLVSLLPF
ncbi:MAG: AzlD domain-containing protein [Clostridia bacterium]|nr:AzlD domain-containing protein [Clostridia bacterium]